MFFPSDSTCSAQSHDKPIITNGVLDLTDWDWKQNDVVTLDGKWEFYWNEFLNPEDFKEADTKINKNFITVPRAWNKYAVNGHQLSGNGYATYRVLINHNSNEVLGIKLPRIFTSYKLWVNGKLLASAGKIADSREQMIPQYLPQVIYFKPESGTIELVIQVANFRHRSGGILESIKLGTAPKINTLRNNNIAFELFLFGSLFITGTYHIALFLFRTKNKAPLYFGIFSLLIGLRTLLVGEIFLINLFPNFSWEIAHKIQTSAYYWGAPLVTSFFKATFPDDISGRVIKFILFFASIFGFLVILTPVRIFSLFNPIYQAFSLFVILYCSYLVVITCYKRRENSLLIGIGALTLFLCSLNDIIFLSIVIADTDNHFLQNMVTRGNLSSWGLLIFVFTQSLVLARIFSKSFLKVESLTEQLQQMNIHLEQKVKERTIDLEKAYEAVSRSEKSLHDFMENISHDLRTPLSAIKGYANAIIDGIVAKGSPQQDKYLARIVGKVDFLNNMVQELLDLSRLESKQMKLEFVKMPVSVLIDYLVDKYSLVMRDQKQDLKIHHPANLCKKNLDKHELESIFIRVDIEKLQRIITNLLSNAFKHSHGKVTLSFHFTEGLKELLIKVSDTGIGISQEDLPYIFDRFYMVSNSHQQSNGSTGIGLAIVKELVEYLNGQIWVESELGKGSSFFLTLPIYHNRLKT